jgi:hypothetical protein
VNLTLEAVRLFTIFNDELTQEICVLMTVCYCTWVSGEIRVYEFLIRAGKI